MKILVTGVAGFIGSAVAQKLLERGDELCCLDNINDYYDVRLKEARLHRLSTFSNYQFHQLDLTDKSAIDRLVKEFRPQKVVNLAAQAGVRHSLSHPQVYVNSNVTGFLNVLEACRYSDSIDYLVYASSSSVYGGSRELPFSTHNRVDHPLSLYAVSKRCNELMAHSYSSLYDIPTTGLRFFSVYGPWGRPDMALFIFTQRILAGEPIDVFNNGNHLRDFTYIDDITEGVIRVVDDVTKPNPDWKAECPDTATSRVPYRIYNIGNHNPVKLEHLINVIERYIGKKAVRNYLPLQAGDVPEAVADVSDLERDFGFRPQTSIEVGVYRFLSWYEQFYGVDLPGLRGNEPEGIEPVVPDITADNLNAS